MAYSDRVERRRLAPLTAVALVHVAIGYAFISGLAMKVIPFHSPITHVEWIDEDVPPPPPNEPPAPPEARPAERVATPVPLVRTPIATMVDLVPLPSERAAPSVPQMPQIAEPEPAPAPDLSRAAAPRGNRAGWITTDDYPSAAIRAEAEGTVGITLRVGTDGRASECSVTRPSGHRALDDATCRLYLRSARFEPARGVDGKPVASTHADRVVWRLP